MSSRELKPRLRLGALLVLLMFALAGGRTEASPAAAAADPPAVITLANGLTVIVDERPDALAIGVSLAARAGTRDDRPGRGGEMALLARALLGGTAAYPSVDRLRRPIERTGGDLELEIDPDLTRYTAVVPPGSLAVAVDTLGAMLREPRFGITDLADAVEATAAGRYSPLDDDISAALWPGHPAGRPSGGTEASRDGITYADLLALRARAFAARNLALAVSGPVSAAEVVAMAESAFGTLPPGEPWPVAAASAAAPDTRSRTFGTFRPQATVFMAFPTVGRTAPDYPAVLLLNLLASGPDGLLSLDVRSRHGLARDVSTLDLTFTDVGALVAVARVQPANVDATVDRFREVFEAIVCDEVTEETLRRLRERLVGERIVERERAADRARDLAERSVRGEPLSDAALLAALAAVTPADVQAAARRYLAPERAIVHVITPDARS